MEARMVFDQLPSSIANNIIVAAKNTYEETDGLLKETLNIENTLAKISLFNFSYEPPSRVACDEFINDVISIIQAYTVLFESNVNPNNTHEVSQKQKLGSLMATGSFVSLSTHLSEFIKKTEQYFEAYARKLAQDERQKNMEQVQAILHKIEDIVEETAKRTQEENADKQRFLDVQALFDKCNEIYSRFINQPPQMIMTEMREVITQCIESMQGTTFSRMSTTIYKLKEVLEEVKKYTTKTSNPMMSHQGASAQVMIAEIKTFFDSQFGNIGNAWRASSGVSRILPILNDEEKSVVKKFEEIQAIAVERLNARTLLGYPISRDDRLMKFYHSIKQANINRLREVKTEDHEETVTSALRNSQ